MEQTKYLIAGSSHAALSALNSIRMLDQDGSLVMITKDGRLPYSPTVLPYVVSGQSKPEKVQLRDDEFFAKNNVNFIAGAGLSGLDADKKTVTLEDGREWRYEKLLLATGAAPAIPGIPGLPDTPYHVLRSMDDAVNLNALLEKVKTAVVLGGGLIGMHAAENLIKAGVAVTIVEMRPQVLPAYFDAQAAKIIEQTFADNGVAMRIGETLVGAQPDGGTPDSKGAKVSLDGGDEISTDLLLVCTGVAPSISYLEGGPVETDQGILVDECMATNIENIWAAGDVAQASNFYGGEKTIGGILPAAVEQGRIAGMAMIDDPAIKPYPGNVPLNTYGFFGNQAVSVGVSDENALGEGTEVSLSVNEEEMFYQKILIGGGCLLGISGINSKFDPGVMWQLVLLRTDLAPVKDEFLRDPATVGLDLMSRIWR
ncbi:MAG: FAD/NAD(P)-binding oxidoreductase [Rhodospirillales bacterium]|jgi:phenylglyoxylate dehydrogenase epsilon subunit|nr:FAD-dependent oxidoreductase [Rhodospirillaceae bacterium]MDP6427607.1 FAD/NAD(P)-binding oxidoreductase [Rhodospirillales bacterium]MDP6645938.1 FAD/NAD(P)-binding oxidoreductase [Rhodospirillales bacterium]|tara:strand:+ start:979 stop:2256 length:1278 start_codon:yes stop_codon:yes gene_type:complete